VVAFQRIFDLSPDGIVGPITWNQIMRECIVTASAPASDSFSNETYTGNFMELGARLASEQPLHYVLNNFGE
jgi:hypothetical protein